RAAVAGHVRLGAAHLAGRDDEALVLDRAGAQQDFPVVLAGVEHERGRHEQELRPAHRQRPVQLGEAQVVADRHAGQVALDLGRDQLAAGRDGRRLAGADAAGDLDVVQVHLAVPRDDLAAPVEQQARVVALARLLAQLVDRAADHPHPVLARLRRERLAGRAGDRLTGGLDPIPAAHVIDVLGQHRQVGARAGRPVEQHQRRLDVRGLVAARVGLQHRDAHRRVLPSVLRHPKGRSVRRHTDEPSEEGSRPYRPPLALVGPATIVVPRSARSSNVRLLGRTIPSAGVARAVAATRAAGVRSLPWEAPCRYGSGSSGSATSARTTPTGWPNAHAAPRSPPSPTWTPPAPRRSHAPSAPGRARPTCSSAATTWTPWSSRRPAPTTSRTCSPPSPPASRSSARSRSPRPSTRASGSSRPRRRPAAGWCRSASCAASTPTTWRCGRRSRTAGSAVRCSSTACTATPRPAPA